LAAPPDAAEEETPIPEITTPPPSPGEIMSVHSLKFMLEDERIPIGARKLFWGYFTRFSSLTNLTDPDIERLMEDYNYACLLYLMKQKQPKAMEKYKKDGESDPLKIIEDQFNQVMFLHEGRSLLFMKLKQSKDALNLQLMATRTPAGQPATAQMPRKPSRWGRLLGRD